jgi:hypothetical protein
MDQLPPPTVGLMRPTWLCVVNVVCSAYIATQQSVASSGAPIVTSSSTTGQTTNTATNAGSTLATPPGPAQT